MAEITAKVYDVAHPSPIPLQNLSAIAVAIQLWHLKLKQRRSKDVSEKFSSDCELNPEIRLRNVIPHVPSVINHITSKYLEQLEQSMDDWLKFHAFYVFEVHRENRNDILNTFDDIVADVDGTVHYTRTAQRMMLCDQIGQVEKFKIACEYCFEDSIRRIWPSVETKLNLNQIDFNNYPRLYYWLCLLRNELSKVPNHDNSPIDETMLFRCSINARSSLEYFWNRASLDSRYLLVKYLHWNCETLFCGRFILPKLSEQQLSALVAEEGSNFVFFIWDSKENKQYVFPIWMYIKDVMKEETFTGLVEMMLVQESRFYYVDNSSIEKSIYDKKNCSSDDLKICCEIWNTAATNLKRSAIKRLFPMMEQIYEKSRVDSLKFQETQFLSAILQDAALEDRRKFLNRNWLYFLTSIRLTDFHQLMKLCLENENEINTFKNDTIAKVENLEETVTVYFERGYFKQLSELLARYAD